MLLIYIYCELKIQLTMFYRVPDLMLHVINIYIYCELKIQLTMFYRVPDLMLHVINIYIVN